MKSVKHEKIKEKLGPPQGPRIGWTWPEKISDRFVIHQWVH